MQILLTLGEQNLSLILNEKNIELRPNDDNLAEVRLNISFRA